MKKKICISVIVLVVLLLAFVASRFYRSFQPCKVAEDEIMLVMKLDLKEDIGLLILDNNMNGKETSGGTSNADGSKLKHDEVLNWIMKKKEYGDPEGTTELSVRFRVVTEYFVPNYDNIYPEEYVVLLEPLTFKVDFGETYNITITGDKENGYQAVLDEN